MARGTQLRELVIQLRHELQQSANPAHGVNTVDSHKYKLNATQEFLWNDFAWSYKNGPFDVETQAGERLYDLPCDQGSIRRVEVKWGNVWHPVAWGIGGRELSSIDSELDERTDPITKLDIRDEGQFEVWPLPATDGNTIRFYGRASYAKLVNDADRAVLDDRLIVLFTAANLAPKEQYQRKLAEANTYYRTMKKRGRIPSRGFVLGGGSGPSRYTPGPVRVAEADRSGN